MLRITLANILLFGFLLTEFLLRKNGESKSLKTDKLDKGSTGIIGFAYIFAIAMLIILSITSVGFFKSRTSGFIGLSLMSIGLLLRIWSMAVLGNYYSRTLRVADDQKIISKGPYHVIRHPGYLSSLLIWVGAGLALNNWILSIIFTPLFVTIYTYRIFAEEKMLIQVFGDEYIGYKEKTWRLIPFIF